VRDAIAERPERWKRAVTGVGGLDDDGDALRRPPRGYDPEHPCADDLRRKSFTSSVSFTQKDACSESFVVRFGEACRSKAPLMEFLTRAVGLPW
jgi:uncharacterized protein (DUF2461 family)